MNTVINGDCLVEMAKLPSESIDVVLTDPPYGDGIGYGRHGKEIANNDDESINYKAIPEFYRLLRQGGVLYLFTNWKFSGKILDFVARETDFNPRTQLVIVKNNFGMGYGFRNQYELCFVFEKGKVEYAGADFSNVIKMEHIEHDKDTHPHQKGIQMLKRMLMHVAKEGGTVLDAFAGSGSTLVAAKELKLNFIGIELDEKWCEVARTRLSQDLLF